MSCGIFSKLRVDLKSPKILIRHLDNIVCKTLSRRCQSAARHPCTEAELKRAITQSWRRETSDDPQRWSRSNPAQGQCAVTALVVQDFFGGDLLCANINMTPHYWNLLPNRCELDLTRNQFQNVVLSGTPFGSTRQYVLSFSETRRNYRRLRKSVRAELNGNDYLT